MVNATRIIFQQFSFVMQWTRHLLIINISGQISSMPSLPCQEISTSSTILMTLRKTSKHEPFFILHFLYFIERESVQGNLIDLKKQSLSN